MPCQFLVYSRVVQLYINTVFIFFLKLLHDIKYSSYATWQELAVYLNYCFLTAFPLLLNPLTSLSSRSVSNSVVSNSGRPRGLQPSRLLYLWNSPGKNTGVGSHSHLQRIFLTQASKPVLLHCRQILYHLSHQGNLSRSLITKIRSKTSTVARLKLQNGLGQNWVLFH